ncbi:MAG: PilZ domain-containing protein [Velocimicrobium sp.]
MRLENLKVGRGLEIYVTREGYRYRLVSTIESTAEGKVYITLIASGNRVFRFLDSDEVDVIYRDDVHIFQWNKVKGTIETLDSVKMHCLSSNKNGESFNRRKSFRVDIGEEIVLYRFHHKESDENEGELPVDEYGNEEGTVTVEEFEGILKDVSENGTGFYTNQVLDNGDEIGFPLFTSLGTMYFKCEVVRHMERRRDKYMEFYGCTFLRSDKNLRKFLFALQREQLQKQRQGD